MNSAKEALTQCVVHVDKRCENAMYEVMEESAFDDLGGRIGNDDYRLRDIIRNELNTTGVVDEDAPNPREQVG